MTKPMKIRARMKDGKVQVRVLMQHPMHSGFEKDASGALIPAWWIEEVTADLNGKQVFACHWGAGISPNPFLQFIIKDGSAGDTVSITWLDSKGETRTDKATVA